MERNESQEIQNASEEIGPGEFGGVPLGPYAAAINGYLANADWLDPLLDAPLIVHARSIATSLDRQMAAKGEIQSALAGSFDKCLLRLEARRPDSDPKPDPLLADDGDGTASLFTHLSD